LADLKALNTLNGVKYSNDAKQSNEILLTMSHRAQCQRFLNLLKGDSKKLQEKIMDVKDSRFLLMGEITLNEALNKSKGTARIQSGNLKAIAGKIISKEKDFDRKF